MSAHLEHPLLGAPPAGWTVGRRGTTLWLVPPGAYVDATRAAIVLSPLLPRGRRLPEPDDLLRQTLAAEASLPGVVVSSVGAPAPLRTPTGLEGSRIEVSLRIAAGTTLREERRSYVFLRDARWVYGVHLLADADLWRLFDPVFTEVVMSVQPHA